MKPLNLIIVRLRHEDGREVDVRLNVSESFRALTYNAQQLRVMNTLDYLGWDNPEPWTIVTWDICTEADDRTDIRIAALAKRDIGFSASRLQNGIVNACAYDTAHGCESVSIRYYPWGGVASVEDAIDQVLSEAERYVERMDGGK